MLTDFIYMCIFKYEHTNMSLCVIFYTHTYVLVLILKVISDKIHFINDIKAEMLSNLSEII